MILSAGTVGSAKLLLLSGVGPAAHLHQLDIPLVQVLLLVLLRLHLSKDLPVGSNLQDHLTTTLGPFMLNSPLGFEPSSLLSPDTYWQFFTKGTGPLSSVGVLKSLPSRTAG